jgi:MFS family permease
LAEATTRYRDVLRVRDFRRIVTAFLIDQIGGWAYSVVVIVWVFDKTHSPTWIAITTASGWVPRAVCSPYAGVLADRYERTKVMLWSSLLSFLAMIGVALVVAKDGPPALALAFGALSICFVSAYRPAAGAVIPDVVSEKELVTANALFGGLENLVVVVGPAIGGLVLVAGSAAVGVTLNALTFLAAGLLVYGLDVRSHGAAGAAGESALSQFADGFRALRRAPMVVVLIVFCYLDSAVYGAATVVYVPLSERLGTGTNGYSYLIAAMALGGVALAAVANRFSASSRLAPLILIGMLMLALPFAATAGIDHVWMAIALQLVAGGGMLIVDILAITAIQRDLPNEVMSRVFGLFEAGVPATLLIASFVTASLLHTFGLTTTLLAIGFGFSGAAVLGLLPLWQADRRAMVAVRALQPRIALLESLDLFAGASRLAVERLAASATEATVAAGDVIIREGDEADALWVLVTGEVTVTARGEAARARRLRTMGPGTYFGEIGLLRRVPRTATVQALEDCTLLRIEGADFLDAVQTAGVSSSLLSQSSSRLARTHPRLSTTAPLAVEVPAS